MNAVEEKKKEIERYKKILDRYGSGRWFRKGQRRLKELEEELVDLENNLGP